MKQHLNDSSCKLVQHCVLITLNFRAWNKKYKKFVQFSKFCRLLNKTLDYRSDSNINHFPDKKLWIFAQSHNHITQNYLLEVRWQLQYWNRIETCPKWQWKWSKPKIQAQLMRSFWNEKTQIFWVKAANYDFSSDRIFCNEKPHP